MTQSMLFTFIIIVVTTAMFIQGKFRSDFIALTALMALAITGILTVDEALSGFSNPIVIMIAGLYVVSAGIFNSGLAERLGSYFLGLSGGSERKLFVIVMLTAGLFSGFLSGTGTVALLLPLVTSMALKQRTSPSRFLLPLAYASSLGGVLTLVSTSPNMIVNDVLGRNGFDSFDVFDFTPIGLVVLAAGLLFMLTAGRKLLPNETVAANKGGKDISASELAGMYKVYDRLCYLHIPADSDIVGERLSDLILPVKYEITVIEITRKMKDIQIPLLQKNQPFSVNADEVLHPDDFILVFGEDASVKRLAQDYELELKRFNAEAIKKHFVGSKFGLTEILIVPHSDYENQTLRDVHFREKYQCSVLAINRKGEYIQADVGTEQLKPGDALLIHGEWDNINRISADLQDVIVIGSEPEEKDQSYPLGKALIAGGIMAFMLIMLAIDVMPPVISVLTAAFLMVVTGCIRSIEEAYQHINWESVFLLAAMMAMAAALEKTGGAMLISNGLNNILGGLGPYAMLAGFYLLTMILSQFISNAASAVLIAPIAFLSAVTLHYSPYPFLLCVAIAASMAFSTPGASPTNALVMTAGEYKYKDFALIGVLLQILIGILMIFAIPLFFPF
ncbi:SLC13 family permease [Peribacillus cavernae]|uniref:SLC13 family permease n=1 Tax=Peribacillus cavernae TaxID=1674310 RepID=A0A433HPP4_9BACI|nr:SLC13 family permease [Peribacillus cavernae]MDQ0217269.1 di/tricarboxylate transporter [Peribacillus cavernae]RUQ30264.1 SLC13 family permease [Peribacillus cavernae]